MSMKKIASQISLLFQVLINYSYHYNAYAALNRTWNTWKMEVEKFPRPTSDAELTDEASANIHSSTVNENCSVAFLKGPLISSLIIVAVSE